MGKRRISISDIIIGQPLPWDAYDLQGLLLLRQGSVVSSENQAQRMVKEGMYSIVEDVSDIEYLPPVKNEPSVVRILNRANWMLRKALPGLQALSNPQAKILEIADMLYHAIELNADVAIACIFLNQQPGGPYKFRHNTDTAIVAALVAKAMGMQREEIITGIAAALTANLGMLDYQDHLDNKKGALTDAEREHIRKHPMHGAEMLRNVGIKDEDWLSYILHHHENEDGSGYPAGKKGAEIPVFAKLIGLADRYTARVTSKDYRKPALPSTALKSIFLSKIQEIDSALAPYFIKEIGLYPPGSFVQLKSYEIALVVKRGANPHHPIAMSVLNATGMPQAGRIVRETANEEYTIRAAVHREIAGANIGMQRFWGPLAAF